MEKIELITESGCEKIKNYCGEINFEYIGNETFSFCKGKVYGIVGEHGEGGEYISSVLSNNIKPRNVQIKMDGQIVTNYTKQKIGWYVGAPIFNALRKEVTVKRALEYAIRKYQKYENIDLILKEFHLTKERICYPLSYYSHERWRASLAIGYASKKNIYCFPWMNSMFFRENLEFSRSYLFFDKIIMGGGVVILPTSKKENLYGLTDDIIIINDCRFSSQITK